MPLWAYKVVAFDTDDKALVVEEYLNKFGADGWELVAVRPCTPAVGSDWQWQALMKREYRKYVPGGD